MSILSFPIYPDSMNKNVPVFLLVLGATSAVLIGAVILASVETQHSTRGSHTDHRQSYNVNYVARPSQSFSPTGAGTAR